MTATGTEARVCQDIEQRQAKGIAKYGTTVEGNPLGLLQWYKHHYEELLDAAVYVKRIIEVMEGVQSPFVDAPHAWEEAPLETHGVEDFVGEQVERMKAQFEEKTRNMREERGILQSTTLEDGSTLTASLGNPQPLDLTGVKEMEVGGFVDMDPHAELRKTWKPGQIWQWKSKFAEDWSATSMRQPDWWPDWEYRRHPFDNQDPEPQDPNANSRSFDEARRRENQGWCGYFGDAGG